MTGPAPVRGLEDPRRVALVLSECQLGTLEPEHGGGSTLAQRAADSGLVHRLARLAAGFRAAGLTVVHGRFAPRADLVGTPANAPLFGSVRKRDHTREGSDAARIHPLLGPEESDVVLTRLHGVSVFAGTGLDALLRAQSVTTVVLAGVSTDMAIVCSTAAAVDLGYRVVVPADCVEGFDPEVHRLHLERTLPVIANVSSGDAVLAALSSPVGQFGPVAPAP